MVILSLFDGISVAQQALKELNIPIEKYYASEIDKYAIQITQKNHPDTIQIGDVKKIRGKDFDKVDLLIGGSPCQDLSIAKKDRKGLDGKQSGLFWEYVRILNEVKPQYFILENVASMPKEAKTIITESLGVEPIMIDAALVSAQRRKRLFWTNIPNITQPDDRKILLKDILEDESDISFDVYNDKFIEGNKAKTLGTNPQCRTAIAGQLIMKTKSNTIRSSGRMSGLGDKHEWDSVYQYRRSYWRKTDSGKVPTLTANMGTGGNNVPYVALTERRTEEAKRIRREYFKKYGKDFSPRREKELAPRGDEKANNITTGTTKESLLLTPFGIRKLTPLECERLQSLPDHYTNGISNTQRYKCLGNAFNCEVIKHIIKKIAP